MSETAPQPAPTAVAAVWTRPPVPRAGLGARVLGVIGIVLASIGVVIAFAYLGLAFGPTGVIIDLLVALVPLAVVLLVIRWLDRWEPEPFWARTFAFLWGAGASIVIALVVDASVQYYDFHANLRYDDVTAALVRSPIVEEAAKGFGVVLIFFVMRRTFDGPVDGIVYGATVAAGFAFVENIQYFANALHEGGGADLAATFFVRGMLSPFAHLVFTSCTGAGLGLATRVRSRGAGVLLFLGGLAAAMLLHSAFNSVGLADGSAYGWLGVYGLIEVPLFLLIVLFVVLARRQEEEHTHRALGQYQAAGWFTADEVAMLGTGRGRQAARRWARSVGRAAPMNAFIADATKLAQTRQRIETGRGVPAARRDERMLLAAVTSDRGALQPALR
ncbi:MAG TPA: PrsW family intramembrane metalloprotease [Gryllotalpicola sp.]